MKIIAFAEQRNNQFKKTAFEVVRAAKTIADQLSAETVALVVGANVSTIAGELGNYGATRVIVVEDSRLQHYSTTAYAKIIAEVAQKESAQIIFLPASSLGKDVAPRVAVKLDAGLATDCTAVRVENGECVAMRPVYAGKGLIDVRITSSVKLFSLRPNVFSSGAPSSGAATVERQNVALTDLDFAAMVIEVKTSSGKKDVAEAEIIVSGGRGLKAA